MTGAQRGKIEVCLKDGCACGSETATMRRRLARATVSIWLQCDTCGGALSRALPRAEHFVWQDYAMWDDALRDSYAAARKAEFNAGSGARRAEYADFLATPEWREMRNRVMRRAGGQCEACLNAAASEVHHDHYFNGWMPPGWVLRAVCRPCHEQFKPQDIEE